MGRGVNKLLLIGNVGRDPEVRVTPGDNPKMIVSFPLATGEKDRTQWHKITCFDPIAKNVELYVKKGAKLYVEGEVRYSNWIDKNTGEKKYMTEIVPHMIEFLSGTVRHDVTDNTQLTAAEQPQQALQEPVQPTPKPSPYESVPNANDFGAGLDDDIPF